jgi:hypothetical protein
MQFGLVKLLRDERLHKRLDVGVAGRRHSIDPDKSWSVEGTNVAKKALLSRQVCEHANKRRALKLARALYRLRAT